MNRKDPGAKNLDKIYIEKSLFLIFPGIAKRKKLNGSKIGYRSFPFFFFCRV